MQDKLTRTDIERSFSVDHQKVNDFISSVALGYWPYAGDLQCSTC